MSHIYSTKFLDAQQLTPGPNTAYLVPTGYTAVLRDVDVWLNAGVSAGTLYLQSIFTGHIFWECIPASAGGEEFFQWRGRQVFAADGVNLIGFSFGVSAGTNTWYIQASGYLLSQP